ncbi:MAG: DNA repair protein RadC [Candidatus Lambdaproteobacteria bacterium]|nr:DNA repair protein RadC [Candidatus Lambdaproteobacteria bacterium]
MDQPRPEDFFARLAAWEGSASASAAFEQLVNRPLAATLPELHDALYGQMLGRLLGWLGLAATPGAAHWEWRALYRLPHEVDPHYFTEEHFCRRIAECPPTTPAQRQQLTEVLTRYFQLRAKGFPKGYPSPLLSVGESSRWCAVLPPASPWAALEPLAAVGLHPLGAPAGWRAWSRYQEGRFDPPLSVESLRQWQALCWSSGDGERDEAAPHRAAFRAAAFGGAYRALHLEGVCGEVPRCGECPLRDECRWARSPRRIEEGAAALRVRARNGRLDLWSLQELLALLFPAPGPAPTGWAWLGEQPLRALGEASPAALESKLGPGPPSAVQIQALLELCKRHNEERIEPGAVLNTAWAVFRHFRMRLRDLKQEQLLVIALDVHRRYLGETLITQGTLDGSPAHPREIFAAAIGARASALLLVHNHPSGNPAPSRLDIAMTRRLMAAGEMMGIPVLDHVIIGDERYVSLVDEGHVTP